MGELSDLIFRRLRPPRPARIAFANNKGNFGVIVIDIGSCLHMDFTVFRGPRTDYAQGCAFMNCFYGNMGGLGIDDFELQVELDEGEDMQIVSRTDVRKVMRHYDVVFGVRRPNSGARQEVTKNILSNLEGLNSTVECVRDESESEIGKAFSNLEDLSTDEQIIWRNFPTLNGLIKTLAGLEFNSGVDETGMFDPFGDINPQAGRFMFPVSYGSRSGSIIQTEVSKLISDLRARGLIEDKAIGLLKAYDSALVEQQPAKSEIKGYVVENVRPIYEGNVLKLIRELPANVRKIEFLLWHDRRGAFTKMRNENTRVNGAGDENPYFNFQCYADEIGVRSYIDVIWDSYSMMTGTGIEEVLSAQNEQE